MASILREGWFLLKESVQSFIGDGVPRLGAALAYYSIISLPPLLIIIIWTAGQMFGEAAAQGRIVVEIEGMIGEDAAEAVQTMIQHAGETGTGLQAALGIGLLILTATVVFSELQASLNTIWGVKQDPEAGFTATIMKRLLSFGMVLGIGFLLAVSFVISAALSVLSEFIGTLLPGPAYVVLLQVIHLLISLVVYTAVFGVMFKVLPDVEMSWRYVWIGAAVTAVLFVIGTLVLSIYIGSSDVGSAYGAAGSLIVLLVWIFYSTQIFFFGAEFTEVYTRRQGAGIVPSEGAVRA